MKIECPHCSCSREMPAESIPDGILTARCPKCGKTFRFSKQEMLEKEAEKLRQAQARGPVAALLTEEEDIKPQEEPVRTEQPAVPSVEETRDANEPEIGREPPLEESQPQPEARPDDGARREARREPERERQSAAEDGDWSFNPWECARSLQEFPPALYNTCLRVMFAPQRFFSSLKPGAVLRALCFFIVICALQTVIEHIWGGIFFSWIMPPTADMDPEVRQLAEMMQNRGNLLVLMLLRGGLLICQLYVFAAVLFICWRLLAGPRADFSLIVQALCYASAPLMLCVIPGVGTVIGSIWCLVAGLIGCRWAMRLSWPQTLLGVTPLILLLIFSYAQFLAMLG